MANVAKQSSRPTRTPIGDKRDILTVKGKEDGYEYRWVNDQGWRVDRFKEAGYEVVSHDVMVGDRKATASSAQGSTTVVPINKQGEKAVLMRIKKEWYDEDQANKQKSVDESEAAMKRELLQDRYGKVEITRK
jgi:hypothetical protein